MTEDADRLLVGIVGRAVGLRGEVEVDVVSDDPNRFAPGGRVTEAATGRALTVRTVRRNRRAVVVSFAEAPDRASADALRGVALVVPRSDARRLGPHEYWDHDLVGCEVVTTDGRSAGRVTEVLHAPANDVLVVPGLAGDQLIPLVADVVVSVDPGRTITIDPIPGLLED